jgi:molybdopterin-guanine dinucleotide biosynthesis protein A
MTIIILAGGKSIRMGRDKAFLKIDKIPLIKRQVRLLKRHFKKIFIVTNSPRKYRRLKGIKVVSDIAAGQGPIGGILSGLSASRDHYNFVVACDMPFISPDLIKYMRRNSSGYDVVVPRIGKRYEPLFCIYSKNCIGRIKAFVGKKILKISRFFPEVKVKEISHEEVARFGCPEKIFMNLNTPKDLFRLNG